MPNLKNLHALQIVKAIGMRARVITTVSTLTVILAGTGAWTHQAYAAKAKAEQQVREQAITLRDVMAKLNQMQSEMQQTSKRVDLELKSLAYEHSQIAAFQVRERAAAPLIQKAQFAPAAALTYPLEFDSEVCLKGSIAGEAKFEEKNGVEASAKANVGLDEFGDGVEGDLKGRQQSRLHFGAGGDLALESNNCLKIVQFNIVDAITSQQASAAMTTGSSQMAAAMVAAHLGTPNLQPTQLAGALSKLQSLILGPTPQKALQTIENPSLIGQDTLALISALPLPGNVNTLLTNPAALLPKPSDLSPQAFCSALSNAGGPLSNICSAVPAALNNLNGLTQFTSTFLNVPADVQTVKSGLQNTCNSLDSVIGQFDAGINIPGAHLATVLGDSINLPAIHVPPPFTIPGVPCQ